MEKIIEAANKVSLEEYQKHLLANMDLLYTFKQQHEQGKSFLVGVPSLGNKVPAHHITPTTGGYNLLLLVLNELEKVTATNLQMVIEKLSKHE